MYRSLIALLLTLNAGHAGEVTAPASETAPPAFDILRATAKADHDLVTFSMTVAEEAGSRLPEATGALAGAAVWSYVWPTSLDPKTVGFEEKSGILALAATSHPDFDDTPAADESGDGNPDNDGALWHSHWVVLVPNADCGPNALSVRDIPEGSTPALPATWPGLPLFIDSPEPRPERNGDGISVTVSLPGASGATFDGVTAALRVNADVHAPLLCVTNVFDVASGDLSLPGSID